MQRGDLPDVSRVFQRPTEIKCNLTKYVDMYVFTLFQDTCTGFTHFSGQTQCTIILFLLNAGKFQIDHLKMHKRS